MKVFIKESEKIVEIELRIKVYSRGIVCIKIVILKIIIINLNYKQKN